MLRRVFIMRKTTPSMNSTKTGYKIKYIEENNKVSYSRDRRIDDFDNAFEDGLFAVPKRKGEPDYNILAVLRWCREHNVDPKTLTDEQLKQFEIH